MRSLNYPEAIDQDHLIYFVTETKKIIFWSVYIKNTYIRICKKLCTCITAWQARTRSPCKYRQLIPGHGGTVFAKIQRRGRNHTLKVQPADRERRREKAEKRPGHH